MLALGWGVEGVIEGGQEQQDVRDGRQDLVGVDGAARVLLVGLEGVG